MKRSLFITLFIGLSAIVSGQSVHILGPDTICRSAYATFDARPQGFTGNITHIEWQIPDAHYIAGTATSTHLENRHITVQFTHSNTFTAKVIYTYTDTMNQEKTVSDAKDITVKDCPSFDCQTGEKNSSFFWEDFGTVSNIRKPLSQPGYTDYQYAPSGKLSKGTYVLTDQPYLVDDELVKTQDHTGNVQGAMMLIRPQTQPDTFYHRVLKGFCGGNHYTFSTAILNVNTKDKIDTGCTGNVHFPNVTFEIVDAQSGISIAKTTTNDVSIKLQEDKDGKLIDDPNWQQFGFRFKIPIGTDSIKMYIYNNTSGGCGNEFAIDDIQINYCVPAVKAYFNNTEIKKDTICKNQPITIHSQLTSGYFDHPVYQWQQSKDSLNWKNITGATNANYSITNADTSDSRYYRYLLFEQGNEDKTDCYDTSDVVRLKINPDLKIKNNLLNQIVCQGSDVSFTIDAAGSHLIYQWQFSDDEGGNWQDISGENTSKLLLPDVQLSDSGKIYRVIVNSDCGKDTSNTAILKVNPDLKIKNTLPNQTVCKGSDVSFNIDATGARLIYQWQFSEDKEGNWQDLSGENTSKLLLSNVQLSDSGKIYRVIVNSDCGKDTSNTAILKVNSRVSIDKNPEDKTIFAGEEVVFEVLTNATNLSYQWRYSTDGGIHWEDLPGETASDLKLSNVALSASGNKYYVVIQSHCKTLISKIATLTVNRNLLIKDQPQDQQVCVDGDVSFSINAEGTHLSYQWESSDDKGATWRKIPSANSKELTFSKVEKKDSGMLYRVLLNSANGKDTSEEVELSVHSNLIIQKEPISQTVCEDSSVSFSVDATGSNLTYQWMFSSDNGTNWSKVPGADNPVLKMPKVTATDDNNTYYAIIQGDCKTDISQIVTLNVHPKFSIQKSPQNQTVCGGDNVSFEVATKGTGLSYQWLSSTDDSSTWEPVNGETSTTLTLKDLKPTDSGTLYSVVVSNPCVSDTSDAALLKVNPKLGIVNKLQDKKVCVNGDVSFTMDVSGNHLTYQWFSSTDGGDTWQELTAETAKTIHLNKVQSSADNTKYYAVVRSHCGRIQSEIVTLHVTPEEEITTEPQDETVCEGSPVSFEIAAKGTNLSYQWQSSADGGSSWSNIPGKTAATLQFSDVSTAQDGYQYRTIVYSNCGEDTSETAVLTVNPKVKITQEPQSQSACIGATTTFNLTAVGENLSYQWMASTDEGDTWKEIPGATSPTLSLSHVQPSDSGTQFYVSIYSDCGNENSQTIQLEVFKNLTINRSPHDTTVRRDFNAYFKVKAVGAGLTYQWQLSDDGGTTWNDLSKDTFPNLFLPSISTTQDGNQYRVKISSDCGDLTSDPAKLTVRIPSGPPAVCEGTDKTYHLTTTLNDIKYQWKKSVDGGNTWHEMTGETTSSLHLTNIPLSFSGTRLKGIAYRNSGNDTSVYRLGVHPKTRITETPKDQEVCPKSNVSFKGAATGYHISYQWQSSDDGGTNWQDISSGGNTTAIFLSAVQPADSGMKYRLIATGRCGKDTSDVATLKVYSPLSITTHPQDQKVCEGTDAIFEVQATGSHLSYQWQSSTDGGNTWSKISGANQKILKIAHVAPSDSGTEYDVIVSGNCGAAISKIAKLRVDKKINISEHPQDKIVCEGSHVLFNIKAEGFDLSYQWQVSKDSGKTWTDISHATHSSLNLNDVTPLQNSGKYRAVLSSKCDKDTSEGVYLQVNPKIPITKEPQDQQVCENGNTVFEVEAQGQNLKYQWYVSSDEGATWSKISGETKAKLTLSNLHVSKDSGKLFYVVVRSNCWSVISRTANLVVKREESIQKSPQDKTVCEGSKVSFDIKADGINMSYQWQLSTDNGSTWSNISKDTSEFTFSKVEVTQNGNQYRVIVNSQCSKDTSDIATLTVKSNVSITKQPKNQTVCEGESPSLEIGFKGENPSIQWQSSTDGGITWHKVARATQAVLPLNQVKESDNGTKYYAIIRSDCKTSMSKVVTLHVKPSLRITEQPQSKAVCEKGGVSFRVKAKGAHVSYQWWSRTSEKGNWTKISGATKDELKLTNVTLSDSGIAYKVTLESDCNRDTSEIAVLTVNPQVALTEQPHDTTVCTGNDVSFHVGITGSHLSFHWMVSEDNGSTWNSLSKDTSTLLLSKVGTEKDGNIYYAIVHGDCGIAISEVVHLTVKPDAEITKQPEDQVVCEKEDVTFQVQATGQHLSYQWQILKNGTGWTNLSSGGKKHILSLSNVAPSDSGQKYRVVVSSDCQSAISDAVTLSILSDVVIQEAPQNQIICVNGNTGFRVKAKGSGLSYQWRVSKDHGVSWTNISGATEERLNLLDVSLSDNENQYQVIVKNSCNSIVSSSAILLVKPNVAILTAPKDTTVCVNTSAIFTVNASGYQLSYQWQSSADGGIQWENLSGDTLSTLELAQVTAQKDGMKYRVMIDSKCQSIISQAVQLNVLPDAKIIEQPENARVCVRGDAIFNVSATGIHLTYQWQQSEDKGATWQDIPSAQKERLLLSDVDFSQGGNKYRVLIQSDCKSTTSQPVSLSVMEGNFPTVRIVPGDTFICNGDQVQLLAIGKYEKGFRWQNGATSTLVTAKDTGVYAVEVYNKCGTDTAVVHLSAGTHCTTDLWIPSAFTPNGDGNNDLFRPIIRHRVYNYTFQIFDRWGNRVFSTNDPEEGWDGKNKGTPCSVGSYIWMIRYQTRPNRGEVIKKGSVTLIR